MSVQFWLDVAALGATMVMATSLALLVLGFAPRRGLNRSFALYSSLGAAWAVSSLLLRLALWLERGNPLLLAELASLFLSLMAAALLAFVLRYVGRPTRWPDFPLALTAVILAVVAIPLFRHQLVHSPRLDVGGSTILELSTWGLVVAAVPMVFFAWSLALFWRARDRMEEPHLALGAFVLVCGFVLGGILEISFPVLSLTNMVGVAILGYGIVRRQLLNPLRESEERFRAIVDGLNDAILVLDVDSEAIVDVNRRFCEMFGYTCQEARQLGFGDLSVGERPYTKQDAMAWIERAREGAPQVFPWRARDKGGRPFWVEVNLRRAMIGGWDRLLMAVRDTTARRRAEKALRESEERFRRLAENAPDVIFRWSVEGGLEYISPIVSEVTGYAPEELVADPLLGLEIATGHDPDLIADYQRALAEGVAFPSRVFPMTRKDGTPAYLDVRSAIVKNEGGQVVAFEGILRDVTQQRQAEAVLRENEARYRALFEQSPISLWEEDFSEVKRIIDGLRDSGITDLEAYLEGHPEVLAQCAAQVRILDVNQATLALLKAPGKAELRAELATIFVDELYDTFRQELVTLARGRTSFAAETAHRTMEGERVDVVVSLVVAPGYEDTWSKVFVSLIDISHRKHADRERARLLASLERRSRQLQTAAEVSKAAGMVLDPQVLMNEAVELIRERFDLYYVGIFLVDGGGEYALLRAGTGEAGRQMLAAGHKLRIGGHSMIGWCIANVRARIASVVGEDAAHFDNPFLPETQSELALPLLRRGQCIGALTVQSSREAAFVDGDVAALQTMADQLAIAIDNAGLYEEARNRAAQLTTLNEVGRAVSQSLDVGAVLRTILEQVKRAIALDAFYICLYDAEQSQISFPLLYDDGRHYRGEAVALAEGSRLSHTLEMAAPQLICRSAEDMAALAHPLHPVGDPAKLSASLLFAPLSVGNRVIGAISAQSYRTNAYGEEDLALLVGVANQAAIAIDNARLYDQVQQHAAELETRVAERTAELDAVNKELEAFAYSVSHDLRAPLRSIDGFGLALLEDYHRELDAVGQDYLRRMRAASQRMAQLIDDLLELSRLTRGSLHREAVSLSAMAQEIAAELQQGQPEREVAFVIADGIVAHGDARLLRVVLENLLGNAWKFTSKHARARIEFGASRRDGALTYFVRDDGAGFDIAYANKLFGAFQRLHGMTEFEGSGVGLATVQRIIHRHGGRVWAEGAVEQGATFYFTLTMEGEG